LGGLLLAGVAEPLVVIDWSDLKEDQSLKEDRGHASRCTLQRIVPAPDPG